jgi:hypothetical protein
MDIKLIKITKEEKTWINPCVGYNKGISQSTGDIIILQNAEVCHIGDVLSYVIKNLRPNDWLTFNCYGLNNFNDNENIYSLSSNKDIYNYINKIWKENNNYSIIPGGNHAFTNNVGGWLNHYLYHFTAYHYLGAIFRNDLMNKMKGGFDLDYKDGLCLDDCDFIKRLIYNNIQFTTNTFSESEPFVIHLYHDRSKNMCSNVEEKFMINKKIYNKKCEYMNITNDWKLNKFMPYPILYNYQDVDYSNINILVGIILDKNSKIDSIKNNAINFINENTTILSNSIKNIKLNIIICAFNEDDNNVKNFINFWKNIFSYKSRTNNFSKNINIIEYSKNYGINFYKIAQYKNDLTLKFYINREINNIYPNNINIYPSLIEYIIDNDTDLFELQKNMVLTSKNIYLKINKKSFSNLTDLNNIRSFYKCMKKGHFYKNSSIKIENKINISWI